MSVSFGFKEKQNLIRMGALFAVSLILWVLSRYPLPLLFLAPLAYWVIASVKIEANGIWKALGWIWTAAYFLIGPVFTYYCVQYNILEDELFAKTKKIIAKYNIMLIMCIYLLFLVLIAEVRWAFCLSHGFLVFVSFIDYFVYEFRQNEISFADITTAGTGLSVLRSYRLKIHDRGAIVLLLTFLAFAVVRRSKMTINMAGRWIIRAAALVALIMLTGSVRSKISRIATQTWEKKGTYKNGFVLNFILSVGDSFIDPPEGYSEEVISELEKEYGKGETKNQAVASAFMGSKKPTIITIMNESFSDFRKIGMLETNVEVMPFIDSLTENTTRGFAQASVYGAKTPNSEWEYLTGNTMAFLPEGSVVYQQYISKKPTSMVSHLSNLGYTTVAMHPYYSTGWRRSTIYPTFGFDEMHFLDTGDFDETKVFREYVTDQEFFDKVINRFENKGEDEALFIMGITMQNHGGYREKYFNFREEVVFGRGLYPDANQYLSLCHETDKAVQNLIEYFESVDEPVEIVFFGDHLPSLNSRVFRELNGRGISGLTLAQLEDLFSVPFFIWTNFDTDEEEVEMTSLNFLGTMALQKAGVPLSPYNRFLSDLREQVPSMNARAFFSKSQGKYLHYDKAVGTEAEWINKYRILQYNNMFDKSGQSKYFFPYLTE